MAYQPTKAMKISCSLDDFFLQWAKVISARMNQISPTHRDLTPRQEQVLAELLKERHNLSKTILDRELLDNICLNAATKKKIRERCGGMTPANFNGVMRELQAAHIIVNNKISPQCVPEFDKNGVFSITLIFDVPEAVYKD